MQIVEVEGPVRVEDDLLEAVHRHPFFAAADMEVYRQDIKEALEKGKPRVKIDGETILLEEADRKHNLELTHLLKTEYLFPRGVRVGDLLHACFLHKDNNYTQENLLSYLTVDEGLVRFLQGAPYMLFGRAETYDSSNPGALFRITRPAIITPEGHPATVREWENGFARYEQEKGLFWKAFSGIKKEKYLKLSR